MQHKAIAAGLIPTDKTGVHKATENKDMSRKWNTESCHELQ